MKNKKNRLFSDKNNMISFSFGELIIMLLLSLIFGVSIGYLFTGDKISFNNRYYHSNEIVKIYNNILDNYYYDVDDAELMDAAVRGMIDSLSDPYSNYMTDDVTSQYNEVIDGYFVGIGVTIQYDANSGYNNIINVVKNGPADKSGVEVGDVIFKVNDADVHGVYGDDLTKLVRGKRGSFVNVTVARGSAIKEYKIKRDIVELDSVYSEVLNSDTKKVGYIKIDAFASNTYKQFNKCLKKLENEGIQSLIIDVRNNPGGHLQQARKILSLFFDKKTVLYQIDNQKIKQKVYSLTNDKREYPVVILMNEESASASEIVAACFRDNYKKISLVGTTTYGKGTVQKTQNLNNGTSIKYTAEKWLTPKGKWIGNVGIVPDYEIKLSDDYYKKTSYENDNQLQEALKILKKES